jgi:ATP-binding cassette subfamily B multidrug efflux pump
MHLVRSLFENVGTIEDSMKTLARRHDIVDRPGAPALVVCRGQIVFEDVWFGYGADSDMYRGFNLRIAPGEKFGLVGPSGSGKTTLMHLLLRLYEPRRGRIVIDNQDIATVQLESLWRQIAVAPQEASFLDGTIGANIALGRPDADHGDVERATRLAVAHDFVARLREDDGRAGFLFEVGERGARLSGGERQRIALARIFLKNAPIVLLDEATASLDAATEAMVHDNIATAMAGRTVIAITHRVAALSAFDRLIVLDGGRIVGDGTPAELAATNTVYAKLLRGSRQDAEIV